MTLSILLTVTFILVTCDCCPLMVSPVFVGMYMSSPNMSASKIPIIWIVSFPRLKVSATFSEFCVASSWFIMASKALGELNVLVPEIILGGFEESSLGVFMADIRRGMFIDSSKPSMPLRVFCKLVFMFCGVFPLGVPMPGKLSVSVLGFCAINSSLGVVVFTFCIVEILFTSSWERFVVCCVLLLFGVICRFIAAVVFMFSILFAIAWFANSIENVSPIPKPKMIVMEVWLLFCCGERF